MFKLLELDYCFQEQVCQTFSPTSFLTCLRYDRKMDDEPNMIGK